MSGGGRTLVLILNWNGLEDTRLCLRALCGDGVTDVEVWVLDNGSVPAQASILAEEFGSRCKVLRSEKNLGFAGGMNLLWQRMLEQDPRSERFTEVLLLNNDARILPGQLRALVEKLRTNPKTAVLGPSLRESATARTEPIGPGWVRFWSGRTVYDSGDLYGEDRACDLVHGAVFLIRRAAVRAMPFDASYFAYYEETELCVRLVREGWKVVWTPAVRCDHRGESSSRRVSGLTEYLMIRNRVRFLLRNGGGLSRVLALGIFTPLYGIRRVVRGALRGEFRLIYMNLTGFWDGFTGRNRIQIEAGG